MLVFSRGIGEYQMMNNIKLAVFEDETSIRDLIRLTLHDTQYTVAEEATTRQQAMDIVTAMHAGELSVGAVLLDGNLDNLERRLFRDAFTIYNYMQELKRPEPVIGISSDHLAMHGVPVPKDLDITKWAITSALIPALDGVFETRQTANSEL